MLRIRRAFRFAKHLNRSSNSPTQRWAQSADDLGENADTIVNSCTSFLFLKDATFAGAFGFGFFPNLWLPTSENSPGQGLTRSLTFIGVNVGMNMGLEFRQDDLRFLKKVFHRRTGVSSLSTP